MCGATVFFSCSLTLVKNLQDYGVTVFQAVLFRQLLGMLIFFPAVLFSGGIKQLKTTVPIKHATRAAFGFLGMCTGYYSLMLINVADSVALQFTLPIFTMFCAVWLLGEKIFAHRVIATLIGFGGVLIIVRPGFTEINYGILFAIASAATHAVSDTYARYLARYDQLKVIMTYNFVFTIPFALIPAIIWWEPVPFEIWPYIILFGVAGISAQFCLTRSFSLADASLVSPILFFRLPLVALIALFAFDQKTEMWTWIGAAIIILATTWMARKETKIS
jgi:drug/metabolite transporter (DMT)-like permease